MGPEHSSCRIERFLQMQNDDPDLFPSDWKEEDFGIKQLYDANWIICNPTTPGNIYSLIPKFLNNTYYFSQRHARPPTSDRSSLPKATHSYDSQISAPTSRSTISMVRHGYWHSVQTTHRRRRPCIQG